MTNSGRKPLVPPPAPSFSAFVFKLKLERGHLLGNADFNSKGSRNIFRINVFDLLVIDGKVFQVLLLNISGYIYQMYNCMQFFLVLRVE